jgi:hypothetical protein
MLDGGFLKLFNFLQTWIIQIKKSPIYEAKLVRLHSWLINFFIEKSIFDFPHHQPKQKAGSFAKNKCVTDGGKNW